MTMNKNPCFLIDTLLNEGPVKPPKRNLVFVEDETTHLVTDEEEPMEIVKRTTVPSSSANTTRTTTTATEEEDENDQTEVNLTPLQQFIATTMSAAKVIPIQPRTIQTQKPPGLMSAEQLQRLYLIHQTLQMNAMTNIRPHMPIPFTQALPKTATPATLPCRIPHRRPSSENGNKSNAKKYRCDVCDKTFSRSNTLITHKRIHTGEKPFKCEHCGRAFRQPGNLTRHRLTHTTVKPYVCSHCDKAFNRASNLHTHMRTHTS